MKSEQTLEDALKGASYLNIDSNPLSIDDVAQSEESTDLQENVHRFACAFSISYSRSSEYFNLHPTGMLTTS